MSLKSKYIAFIGLLHLVMVLLVYQVLKEKVWLFILCEALILGSLYLSYLLYKSLIQPISMMQSGTEAISNADYSVKYLNTGSKEMDQLIGVYNSMIDQLRAERVSMSEQGHFINRLLEVTPLSIVIFDYDGNISLANRSAEKTLDLPLDYEGERLQSYDHPLIQKIYENIDRKDSFVIALDGNTKYKCQVGDVVHQGFKRRFLMIDDLSAQLLETEKNAYGKIIRMMAHEVNNSIGAINSILDTVQDVGLGEEDEDLKASLQVAIDRNEGLCDFVDRYASVLRLPEPQFRPTSINDLLLKCNQLYTSVAHENDISIELRLNNENPTINGDSILLEQAIANILKNAIESIGEDGDIIINSGIRPLGFSIMDNGVGVTKEQEAKLFTPFYSTKPTGQGVGLMLIREILDSHKATYKLITDRESGWTTFEVQF